MRARYYNTDIKRFINRDVVNGSIENSQSLNKYSYVQGNPVKLTDPFGLSPVGGDPYSLLSTIGHTILDVAGIFFDGADIINALWYAAEGNTFMAATSAIAALPAIGSFVSGSLKICMKGSKAAFKAANLITQSTRLTSHGAQMTMSAIDSYYAAVDYKQAKANGESGDAEAVQLALSVAGAVFSSGGATNSGKRLADAMYEGQQVKKAVDKVSRGVSSAITETAFVMNKGKRVVGGKVTLKHQATSGVNLISTPGKTTTILGRYAQDTGAIIDELKIPKNTDFSGRPGGFNLLNTPDEYYISAKQFWDEYNKPWLDRAIERDDIFKLATDPTWSNLTDISIKTGKTEITGFGREYLYLKKHGYYYDKPTKSMMR